MRTLFLMLTLAACSSGEPEEPFAESDADTDTDTDTDTDSDTDSDTDADADVDADADADAEPDPEPDVGDPALGTLTAGVWDDNLNYDWFTDYLQDTAPHGAVGILDADREAARARHLDVLTARTTLDVAIVLDTTGSMGDELDYLQVELAGLVTRIDAAYPNADSRWSLVLYRDEGDAYVTQVHPFTGEVGPVVTALHAATANGGGDYPEASERALSDLVQLSWRASESTAKLAFWLTDAPHAPSDAPALRTALEAAASQEVHLYPVAASGVNDLAEHTMRQAAQLTNGRYMFLTDDSGVGGPHAEPTIPCYFVTTLVDAVERMVAIEMSGVYAEPDPSTILRTGGDPQSGACTLDDGSQIAIF